MNKFLNYSGLITFIDKCKSYFQKKDIVINISRNNDGNWEISSNPFNDIKKNIDSANIVVNVVDNGYKYKAANISYVYYTDTNYFVNFDVLTYIADDNIQYIYHFRLDILEDNVDIYFTQQEHIYSDDFILTGINSIKKSDIGFAKIYKKHPDNLTNEEIDKAFEYLDNNERVACVVNGLTYTMCLIDDDSMKCCVLTNNGEIEECNITRNYDIAGGSMYVVYTNYKKLNLKTNGDGTKVLANNGEYVELPSSSSSSYFTIDATNLDEINDNEENIAELWNVITTGTPILIKNISVHNTYLCHTFATVSRTIDAMDAVISVTLTTDDEEVISGRLIFDITSGFGVSDFVIPK